MRRVKQFINVFREMRIVHKIIIGYILLIFIPFVLFGFFFYKQMYDNLLNQYLVDREKFIEHSLANLEIELFRTESVFPLFQNNDQLIEYLEGRYEWDWEMVYNYRKHIDPIFSFSQISNPLITNITTYKYNSEVLSLAPDIMDETLFSAPVDQNKIRMLSPNSDLWTYDTVQSDVLPSLYYTKKLYNDAYTQELGFVTFQLSNQLFKQFFNSLPVESELWSAILNNEQQFIYKESVPGWTAAELENLKERVPVTGLSSFYAKENQYLVHAVNIPKLNLVILGIGSVESLINLRDDSGWTIVFGVLLLGILSLFYFTIASSFAKRLILFSRHLKRVDDPKLALYSSQSGADEIGFLITSYNAMIRRIDELTEDFHRSELLKKEAEIKMLQAQIKPHFIYNTLETMRMMALVKNQMDLAEVASSLGNFLRYSLAKNKDETTFLEELENVKNYVEIHKIRMGSRLQFEMEMQEELRDFYTPRFILQPIVENSILHGLGAIRGTGKISLIVRDSPDAVIIRVIDNGGGIPQEKLNKIQNMLSGDDLSPMPSTVGIGIYNVNERIKSYFGRNSGIRVESLVGEETVFEIRLGKGGSYRYVKALDRG